MVDPKDAVRFERQNKRTSHELVCDAQQTLSTRLTLSFR